MKRILYTIALVGLFSACNNSKSTTETKTQIATQGGLSGLQNAPAPATESQAGLLTNPEHGQPGHDCAFPVGAPLPQKTGTKQSAADGTISSTPTATPATGKPTSTVKINPAHGEPGHDCAKPVGAPLS